MPESQKEKVRERKSEREREREKERETERERDRERPVVPAERDANERKVAVGQNPKLPRRQ